MIIRNDGNSYWFFVPRAIGMRPKPPAGIGRHLLSNLSFIISLLG